MKKHGIVAVLFVWCAAALAVECSTGPQETSVSIQNSDGQPFTITQKQLKFLSKLNDLYETKIKKLKVTKGMVSVMTNITTEEWQTNVEPFLTEFPDPSSITDTQMRQFISLKFPSPEQQHSVQITAEKLGMYQVHNATLRLLKAEKQFELKTSDYQPISVDNKIINARYLGNVVLDAITTLNRIPFTLEEWNLYISPLIGDMINESADQNKKIADTIQKRYPTDKELGYFIHFTDTQGITFLRDLGLDVAAERLLADKEKYANNNNPFGLYTYTPTNGLLLERLKQKSGFGYVFKKTSASISDSLKGIIFSPDGKTLAGVTEDNNISVWSTEPPYSHKVLKKLNSLDVLQLLFNKSGTRIAAALPHGTINTWDINSEKVFAVLPTYAQQLTLAFAGDSNTLLAANLMSNKIEISNVNKERIEKTIQVPANSIQLISFNSQGTRIAIISKTLTLHVRNLQTDDTVTLKNALSSEVKQVAFSPDNTQLVTISADNTVTVFALTSILQKTKQFKLSTPVTQTAIAFVQKNTPLILGSYNNLLYIWNGQTGALSTTVQTDSETIQSFAVNNDLTMLATGTATSVQLWQNVSEANTISSLLTALIKSGNITPESGQVTRNPSDTVIKYFKSWFGRRK